MPEIVRIRQTGKALYVVGRSPEKKGDRFEATTVLETRAGGEDVGCRIVGTPGGGTAFSCSRSRPTYGGAGAAVKTYVFDPEKHELEGGALEAGS